MLHGLVPPHPGPLIAISAVGAKIGVTMLYGFLVAIPTAIIAGPLFARVAMRLAHAEPPANLLEQVAAETSSSGLARGFDRGTLRRFSTEALAPTATILLVIDAGGGFNGVLVDSGIGKAIGTGVHTLAIWALLLGWLVAVLIRVATGSASVATIAAARDDGADRRPQFGQPAAAGAVDRMRVAVLLPRQRRGFWLVNQYFGMSVPDTLKTWIDVGTTSAKAVGFDADGGECGSASRGCALGEGGAGEAEQDPERAARRDNARRTRRSGTPIHPMAPLPKLI